MVILGAPDDEGLLDRWNKELDEDNPDTPAVLQALTRLSGPTVQAVCLHRIDEDLFLDSAGSIPLDLDVEPGLKQAKALLGCAVSLSYMGCVADFPATTCPPAWRRSALLRHHRLALFEGGRLQAGRKQLRLDPELGIVTERIPQKGEEDEAVVQSDQ